METGLVLGAALAYNLAVIYYALLSSSARPFSF